MTEPPSDRADRRAAARGWPVLRSAFGIIFLATGAALVAYIASGISLLLTATGVLAVCVTLGWVIYRAADGRRRRELRRRLVGGIAVGVAATAAYDVSRFALIEVTGIRFWPFDIFGVFGQALFGPDAAGPWVSVAGAAYHLANGIGFAVAYVVLFGTRGLLWGIGWAMGLEVAMLTIYPGWLDIRAVEELFAVSIVGHAVYGGILGAGGRWVLVSGPLRQESAHA